MTVLNRIYCSRFLLFYFLDQKLCLVLEDITLSVDVQDVYSKFKMNLGAANIDHFVRERYANTWKSILDLISMLQ